MELELRTDSYTYCLDCDRELRGARYRITGYCYECYWNRYGRYKKPLPPLRRWYKGGWQKLLSPSDRERHEKPFNDIIDKIDCEASPKHRVGDRENLTTENTEISSVNSVVKERVSHEQILERSNQEGD